MLDWKNFEKGEMGYGERVGLWECCYDVFLFRFVVRSISLCDVSVLFIDCFQFLIFVYYCSCPVFSLLILIV